MGHEGLRLRSLYEVIKGEGIMCFELGKKVHKMSLSSCLERDKMKEERCLEQGTRVHEVSECFPAGAHLSA